MTLGATTAAAVRDAMKAQRVPQTAIAAALGVTQGGVSRRLAGVTPLTLDELDAIASVLDLDPLELLSAGVEGRER